MCGRYTLAPGQGHWEFAEVGIEWDGGPRYNIAPSQRAPVIITERGKPVLAEMQWGLVPSWAEDPKIGHSLVNARSESVATRPAFRAAFRHRRCLVPSDGFYEWQTVGRKKQPWRFVRCDRTPFLFAGIWESWSNLGSDATPLRTFSLLTTIPNEVVEPVHDRMPVILSREDVLTWIDDSSSVDRLESLLKPYPGVELTRYRVNALVGNAAVEGADCIREVNADDDLGPKQMELW